MVMELVNLSDLPLSRKKTRVTSLYQGWSDWLSDLYKVYKTTIQLCYMLDDIYTHVYKNISAWYWYLSIPEFRYAINIYIHDIRKYIMLYGHYFSAFNELVFINYKI